MIFMVGTENVKADDTGGIRSGDYEYQILSAENKTAALRKVYNYGTEVIIPDSIDGYRIVVIGKKVKNIKLGPCNCGNIVLRNPKTILDIFSSDECDVDKLSAVISKDIKCKKRSGKYIYSWKPIKVKGKKYTVKYAISYRKSNGKFYKFREIKKSSVKLDKKRKLRIEVKVQFKE